MRFCAILFLFLSFRGSAQITTVVEKSDFTQTPTYHQIIDWWKKADAVSSMVKMQTMGPTDAGYPLHLVLVSAAGDFDIERNRRNNKRIIFINNGIHPGEPDGIDASMLLVRDILSKKANFPSNILLALIPVYNIGGCLNRSAFYRADQNGPEEFGFRGNSQNLDLNRDFIKSDSKEARSFAQIFHYLDPDVFMDNHVSNGADYQHVMTLVASQHNKLGGVMGEYMNKTFEPGLYPLMKKRGYDLIPYVNYFGSTPDQGWNEFFDSPRYSSGYASLFHTFAFVPETHMLKSYEQRVKSTYALMHSMIEYVSANSEDIKRLRQQQKQNAVTATEFPVKWEIDRSKFSTITYLGYNTINRKSKVSGVERFFYDRSQPYEKQINFYNHYRPTLTIKKPKAYLIPQGWWPVIELLRVNKIKMKPLAKDTSINVEYYRIESYTSSPRPFEMHHINSDVKVSSHSARLEFRKGDVLIPLDQPGNRFLIEVLEPQADDSYFAWNFFDSILGQKEGFSNYAFEEVAAEYLKNNDGLRKALEERRQSDSAFAKNANAQLDFVYRNSKFYEPAHMRYPVFRVE